MTVALLLIGDGRDDVHARSVQSAQDNLPAAFDERVVVDDRDHQLGFAGAIAQGWEQVLAAGVEFCFWLECDFEFLRPVPLDRMLAVLKAREHLVQIALLRQPVNDEEIAAGGIIQQHPEDYEMWGAGESRWIEHRRFFTTNPCLVPTWIMRGGWPHVEQSEGHFGINLFASDPRLRSAYWGSGEQWVEHVGMVRAGHGY